MMRPSNVLTATRSRCDPMVTRHVEHVAYRAPNPDMTASPQPRRDPVVLTKRFVQVGALRWAVTEGGAGPVLFFLHGTGGSTHSMEPIMRALGDRFRVVAVDLPGHGDTQYPGFSNITLVSMASLCGDILTALRETPRAVVAHSAGAAIAVQMHLLGRLPSSTAILAINAALSPHIISSLGPLSDAIGAITTSPISRYAARTLGGSRAFIEGLLGSTGSRLTPAQVGAYVTLFGRESHAEAAYAMSANWDLGPMWAQLVSVRAPVLLMAGEEDHWVPWRDADRAAARIPGAVVRRFPHLGHLAHEEQPDLVASTIAAFLSTLPSA